MTTSTRAVGTTPVRWPELPVARVGADPLHPAHVAPDRRQSPARPGAAAQPLVARPAVRDRARPDDVTSPVRRPRVQVDFDFVEHRLHVTDGDPGSFTMSLEARSVARFYPRLPGGAPEPRHRRHPSRPIRWRSPTPSRSTWTRGMTRTTRSTRSCCGGRWSRSAAVLKVFQTGFVGKASPIHFFWGGFDLATTRFSGHPAPRHPGGIPNCPGWVMEEAEISSERNRRLVALERPAGTGVLRLRLPRA